jgi:Cu(I)/Ag(I) efflux system membrane fusion protein
MTTKSFVIAAVALVGLGAAGYGLYSLGMRHGMQMTPAAESPSPAAVAKAETGTDNVVTGEDATRRHIKDGLKAGDVDPAAGKRILYYYDPMVPGETFDAPGKSPYMNMMLLPKYAGADTDRGNVGISPRMQQNLGIRTAPAVKGSLARNVTAPGTITYNERDQVAVQARANGFVERLYVRATLDPVRQGQPLAELYVPEWVAAQEEFLAVRRMQGTDLASLVDGARQRMRQAGMSEAQIRQVEEAGKVQPRMVLAAPIAGVITELSAREGMTVAAGAPLFRINGVGTVWANAEVPESQATLVRPGARVEARSPAIPDATFTGRVQALLPEVNAATRTIKARIELANPGGRLSPGMFINVAFTDPATRETLLVPSEAVITTGRRTVIMVAEESGKYRPVDVDIGMESGGQTEIKKGLQPGQQVVVSGQFLLDSEASLSGMQARMDTSPPSAAGSVTHKGTAKVESIEPDTVTLSHGPIPSLQWSDMTMTFKKPASGAMPNLKPGDRVDFEFEMGKEGAQLTAIRPLSAGSVK